VGYGPMLPQLAKVLASLRLLHPSHHCSSPACHKAGKVQEEAAASVVCATAL
jgi:hypothetical protein